MSCNDLIIMTPTRNRPEQLSTVIECMNNQTLKPDCWKIVDDSDKPLSQEILDKIQIPYEYVHWINPRHNIKSNLINSAKCFEDSNADNVVFIEDDDYYPSRYLEKFMEELDKVAEGTFVQCSEYFDYRLSDCHWRMGKLDGAVWHYEGFHGERVIQSLGNELFHSYWKFCKYGGRLPNADDVLNDLIRARKYEHKFVDFGKTTGISFKDWGIGTPGITAQHRTNRGFKVDDDLSWFKERLGDDWKRYEKYLGWRKKGKTSCKPR